MVIEHLAQQIAHMHMIEINARDPQFGHAVLPMAQPVFCRCLTRLHNVVDFVFQIGREGVEKTNDPLGHDQAGQIIVGRDPPLGSRHTAPVNFAHDPVGLARQTQGTGRRAAGSP